ncbi:armadillo-type protein, partial [Piptocephalis cylindrospora]
MAACQCARSVSRSVRLLRTTLVDHGAAAPLVALLREREKNLLVLALITLCNIILEFSPMKRAIMDTEGLERIVQLSRDADIDIRYNAVFALGNLTAQASSDIKEKILGSMGYPGLRALLDDSDLRVQ